MIFPASRDINSFAMMSFEKDGQIVSLPVRVFSFSNQQFDLSVLYRETETSPWRKFGEVASLPGKALSPEITLSSSGELLVFNKGKELVQFKGPVHVLIPRGIATCQSINLGDNTVLPPGYAGMIRLADVNDLSSRVTIHFSKGDLLIAWGFIAFVHKYGAIGGVALLLLAGAVFFRWRQSKRKPAGGLS